MRAQTPPAIDHQRVIAIDGPAAAGKSTVARILADRLGALLFDTGVLYRAVALEALRGGVAPRDTAAICRLARELDVDVRPPSVRDSRLYDVWRGDEDVTWAIRAPEVNAIVSQVAANPQVRAALLPLQRRIAASGGVVMVGRDIGTVVVPDAGLKIFLDATPEERARRRYQEAASRGSPETFAEVLAETARRDEIDRGRETAPLREAADALRVETDELEADEVAALIERRARSLRLPSGELLWPA
jgi:cytidylate kinase